MRRALLPSILLLVDVMRTAGAAGVEAQPADTHGPSGTVSAWTSFRAGVVHAPYPSATLGEVESGPGQARLFRFGAAVRFATNAWVGAHAAYVSSGVEQPAGSYRAANVWGNPIVFATLARPDLWTVIGSTIDAELSLGIGVPVAAERGAPYEQLDRRALSIGNALEGMTNPESFTPNVLPLTLSGALVWPREYFQLSLACELPWLVRLSDDTIPDGASASPIGFVPNGEVRLATWPWSWLGLSLGGTVAWPLVEPVYLASSLGDPQAMLVPRVLFGLGKVLITLEVGAAVGGPASGTVSGELSARLAL